uniref:Uncharacterized protein n=1 Tax=Opuntia streptacantha TaxID=393608 RepID=A0A7C9DCM7_OPUST
MDLGFAQVGCLFMRLLIWIASRNLQRLQSPMVPSKADICWSSLISFSIFTYLEFFFLGHGFTRYLIFFHYYLVRVELLLIYKKIKKIITSLEVLDSRLN